jgi:8-oxo-dGTP pyrophosphatase MutT (NUDIX family)
VIDEKRGFSYAANHLLELLEEWSPATARQRTLRRQLVTFVRHRRERGLDRDSGPEHVTASCYVFSPDLSQVLLCYHKKGRFWLQLGGHVEEHDETVLATAIREGIEEGGIEHLQAIGAGPLDLSHHHLGDGFSTCSTHWDIAFAATASVIAPKVSHESDDVRWWDVTMLPSDVPVGFRQRLNSVIAACKVLAPGEAAS